MYIWGPVSLGHHPYPPLWALDNAKYLGSFSRLLEIIGG